MATTKALELAQLSALTTVDGNIDISGNISDQIVVGSTSDNTSEALVVKDSSNANLFRVRSDGVVLIDDNYLYVTATAGAYFDGSIKARGGIHSDTAGAKLNLSDTEGVDVASTATSTSSTTGALTIAGGVGIVENLNVGGDVTVTGDLTVDGTTVTLNTTDLNVEDKNITLNYHATADTSTTAAGAGITIQDAVDASNDASILWDQSHSEFDVSHSMKIAGSVGVTNVVTNKVVKFDGSVLNDSNITDDGTTITASSDFNTSGQMTFTTNAEAIRMRDSSGLYTRTMILNASDTFYIGPVDTYSGGAILYGASADVTAQQFYTGGDLRFLIGSSGESSFYDTSNNVGMKWNDNLNLYGTVSNGVVTPRKLTFDTSFGAGGITENKATIGIVEFQGSDASYNADGNYATIASYILDGNNSIQGSASEGGSLEFSVFRHDVSTDPRVETVALKIDQYGRTTQQVDNTTSGYDWQVTNNENEAAIRFESSGGAASLYLDGSNGDFVGSDYGLIQHTGTKLYLGTHSNFNLGLSQNDFVWNTNDTATPFYISRYDVTNQSLKITVDDGRVNFHSIQDESDTGDFRFFLGTLNSQDTTFSIHGGTASTPLFSVQDDGLVTAKTVILDNIEKSTGTALVNARAMPSFKFDFARMRSLPGHVKFSRTTQATSFDSNGNMVNNSKNIPRFDHDPLTGKPLGILFERSSTNYFLDSTTGGWSSVRGTKSANATIYKGIKGYHHSDTGGSPNINKNLSIATDATWVWSFYIDATNLATNAIEVNFSSNGAANQGCRGFVTFTATNGEYKTASFGSLTYGSNAVANSGSGSLQYIGDSVWRVSLSFTFNAVTSTVFPILYYGTGSSNVWTGGHQLEVNRTYPSSLIVNDNTGSTVSRTSENCSLENITDYFSTAQQFTFYYEASIKDDDEWNDNGHTAAFNGSNFIFFYGRNSGGGTSMGIANRISTGYTFAGSNTVTPGTYNKAAIRIAKNNGRLCLNGELLTEDTSFYANEQTNMNIGRGPGSSEYFEGHINSIRVYSKALPDAELQELTRQ